MIDYVVDDVIGFFLVFCRIGACFMVMPGLSSMRVSPQIRLYAALTMSVALATLMPQPTDFQSQANDILLLSIFRELIIGLYFGLIVRFYLLAFDFIAAGIAMTIGFGGMLGAPVEGTDAQSALASFISFSALFLLMVFDFHHMVLTALVNTYQIQPVAQFPNMRLLLVGMTDVLVQSFSIALRLGSPFIGYAIIVNLAVGFLNKLAPQLPLYFVALPIMLFGALFVLYFVSPYMFDLFTQMVPSLFETGLR